jgi:8-oxo-dGTP pyrophosphatase MutT (NUDIX family)
MTGSAGCPPPPPAVLPTVGDLADALRDALAERPPVVAGGGGRRAAVLIVLYERDGEPHLLLTKRSDDLPSHPGQISLPGGVVERDDASPADAALRETEEEVGVPRGALVVLGELDDVHTMASNFVVRPFVALHEGELVAVPSDAEVARVMHVTVADLLRADAALPPGVALLELRYPLAGEDVWGATARILRTFSRVLRCALSPGDAAPPTAAAGGPGS